jgi:hypothetical protein
MKNPVINIDESTVAIQINNKKYGTKYCLIDREDLPRVSVFNWHLSAITRRNKTHYAVSSIGGKTLPMHRLVMSFPLLQIDHINMIGLDNRKLNLREATASQNAFNKLVQPNNKLGVKGIQKRLSSNGTISYRARIRVNGKLITLGHRSTLEEAIELRKLADIKYFIQSF